MKSNTFFLSLILFVVIFAVSFHVTDAKYTILSSPVSLGFDQYNVIKEIKIRFMPETSFQKQDTIMISFSSPIEAIPGALSYSLIDEFRKELARGSFNPITDVTINSLNLQYFKNGAASSYTTDLMQSTWYLNSNQIKSQWLTLILNIPRNLANTFASNLGSISMAVISSLDVQHVRYQWTNSMSYFYYASLAAVAPAQSISAILANHIYGKTGETLSQVPGAVYPVYLELTPLINFSDFILNIQFTKKTVADLLAFTTVTQFNNFNFQGTCYFICQSTITCIAAQYCRVSNQKIQVKIGQLQTGKKYVLRFSVLNPPYVANTNIMLWIDSNGTAMDMANVVSQLATQPITITQDEMKLFWKVPYSTVIQPMSLGGMGLGIFVDGGINTVEIGFKINSASPFGQILQVKVHVGSTQLIMQSINHNLPSVNTTISFEYIFPNLIIKNVTALTRTNFRYWVAFRNRYTSTAPDNVNLLGSVDIKLAKYPSPTIILFNPLSVTTTRITIPFSDFRDTTGFHSPSLFKNFDTQVISSTDNMLENATSQAIRKYLNQATTVGVDPEIMNQQLLFLLNVPAAKIALATLGQKYDTRIFFNPNIFQSVSDKGISLVAYNGATTKWDNFGNDCYVDQQPLNFTKQTFMCQKFNDHVFDQQYDNILNTQPNFKYYQHTCGNGIKVKCLVPSCISQCTLFKGYVSALSHGKAGIAAIRNVTFIPNYRSPVEASDKNFDFIISFYHDGAFVSSTLINAYTIKSLPLKRTTLSFINTYHDGTKYNLGDKIPTLIKLSGRLELSQYINLQYPQKMKLYFPSTKVALNSFVSNINEVGCSHFCRFNESKSLAVTQNYLQWHTVSIGNMPQLTNDFKIIVPIQLKANLMSIYVGFQAKGKTVAIYRFGGSAVNQLISLPLNNLFTTQTYTTPWDLVSDWVIGPGFTYSQKINLQQTNSYDNFTLITMSGSVMPAHAKPYVTFSVKNLQMLAPYTNIIVGNSLQNRSCDKLTYFYNLKKIQCFICQLYTNDNTTNNNIRIEYPLFNNDLGPGYPYDQLFNFAYASDGVDGQLEGIRRQLGDKVLINNCKTNKATEYNVGEDGRQLELYRIQIDPVLLSAATYTKLQLILEIPNNIQPVQCSIVDVIFFSKISCSVLSQVSNITTLQLSISPTDKVTLLEFYVYLNCYQTGNMSLTAGQLYKLKIKYPHTNGAVQAIYGTTFSPYSSTIYQCENSFTYINAAYNNTIIITSHKLNTVGMNMNSQLEFNITLSKQKSHLLKNSYIEFSFTQLQVTDHSFCYLTTFGHRFWKRTWTANSYRLFTNSDVQGFTANPIIVKCSNLILRGMSPTLIIKVFDITANLLIMISSNGATYPLIANPYFPNPSPITSTGTISSKQYTTLGFNSLYTITFTISGTGMVQGIIDLSEYSIDYRLLRCQLSIAQDVFCKLHELNTNTNLQSRSRHVYFKTYFLSSFSSFTLMIYPILQQKRIIPPVVNSLIKVGTNLHYVSITDTLPTIPVDDVFLINDYKVTPIINSNSVKFALQVMFTFTVTITRPIYLQLNQIFFYTQIQNVIIKCTINTITIVPCTVIQKDLIKIDTSTFTLNLPYTLKIQSFDANYQITLKDKQNFFIKMFVIDPATKQIDYVSYMNTGFTLPTTLMSTIKSYQTMFGKSYLIWNTTDTITQITYVPKIYIGYYGLPVDLIQYDSNKFSQDFLLSSNNYTLSNFNCEMGMRKCQLSLIAQDFSTVFKSIYFTHLSTMYNQPPVLTVQVSNEKCVINAEFINYKIYQNGITLPILLNFTQCKPRSMLTIVPTFNSTQVSIDGSLSQLEITQNNPIGIIFVRHSSTDVTLKNYSLSLTLSGTYVSSFTIPTSYTIEKIARTETNIQAKTPQTLSLQPSEFKVRIQCNQPSTVYWAIGFYPTTLGVKGQDIQTRLLNGQVGLRTSIVDYLIYGNLEYGMTYTEVPNVWKQLVIDELIGNTMYSFKYFCVNIKGTFSDGKILTFTTPPSIYSMVKLQLGFTSPLNYGKVNDFACALSQSLIIPYKETITSVNSNCKNASLIFFDTYNDMIWNFNISSATSQSFFYNFYIKSFTLSAANITSSLRDLLRKNSRIMKSQLPLWSQFSIQQIEPNAITPALNGDPTTIIDQTVIEMTFPITNQICYVIVGLLSSYFNNQTMSLPATYMIKQGKFSQNVDFDRVYMNYTTNDIKFTFDGLNADTQYSIFYFVTVDDPSINAKHSQVKYVNIVTAPYLQVDLFGINLKQYGIYWIGVLLLTIFLLG